MGAIQIGRQIFLLRQERKVFLRELARGVCSEKELSDIENGTVVPDKLLVDVLIQRLGKSADKLEFILPALEYRMEQMRDDYERLLEEGKGAEAEELLKSYEKKYSGQYGQIQKMYCCRSRAYAAYRLHHDIEEAEGWLWEALKITLGGWEEGCWEEWLISTMEMENLLAYAKVVWEMPAEAEWKHEGKVRKEKKKLEGGTEKDKKEKRSNWVRGFLKKCREYIDQKITDGEEHAKIFGKCAWLIARDFHADSRYEEAVDLCEQALHELMFFGISYFMLPLLRLAEDSTRELWDAGDAVFLERARHYQRLRAALENANKNYRQERHLEDSIFHNCFQKEYHLDGEIIRGSRLKRRETQSQFIKGLYASVNVLSRIENGKESPNKKKFKEIMDRIGLQKERYNPFLLSSQFEDLEKKQEIDILINRNCFLDAERALLRLKKKLDLSHMENRRVVEYYRNLIDFFEKRMPYGIILERVEQLLAETYTIINGKAYRPPFELEVKMINLIALLLEKLGRKEEELILYQIVLDAMDCSKIDIKYRYRSYSLILENLAIELESAELAQKGIRYTLVCGKLNCLHVNYLTIADAWIGDSDKQDLCREIIRDAYYLSELAMNNRNRSIILHYYEEKFGKPMLEDN